MIIPKKKNKTEPEEVLVPERIQIPKNGLIAVFHAIKDILKQVRWDYYDPSSERIFKTVMMNRGQFERIVRKGGNSEYALAFPAAFIEFTNWRYLVQQQRINEGRADMQIKFVMNRLNNQDPDVFGEDGNVSEHRETEVEYVAQIINQFIQELKSNYPALSERVNLTYVDPLESFDNGLQPCWVTYEVWFREESIYATRWLKNTFIVFPPYTNHSDQKPENNVNGHTNYDHPELHQDHSRYLNEGTGKDEGDEGKEYDPGYDGSTDTTPDDVDLNNGRISSSGSGTVVRPGTHMSDVEYDDYLHLITYNDDND